jgi:hypothetical protein
MREKIDEAENRIKYGQRMHIREPVLANIKYCKEMNRFTMRGKVQVNRQPVLYRVQHREMCGGLWPEGAWRGVYLKMSFWGEDTGSGKAFFCEFNRTVYGSGLKSLRFRSARSFHSHASLWHIWAA